ncbi:hypothetical protein JOB18_005874, partial [Solea senegalensis]
VPGPPGYGASSKRLSHRVVPAVDLCCRERLSTSVLSWTDETVQTVGPRGAERNTHVTYIKGLIRVVQLCGVGGTPIMLTKARECLQLRREFIYIRYQVWKWRNEKALKKRHRT